MLSVQYLLISWLAVYMLHVAFKIYQRCSLGIVEVPGLSC